MVLEKKDITSAKNAFFWSDIAFHVIYNIMIGYIVIANTLSERFYILTYFIAFGLHFLMNDWLLYHHHGALFVSLPYYLVVIIEALITGALLVNIIKFELPNEGEGSIRGLLVGTICSGILFVFV